MSDANGVNTLVYNEPALRQLTFINAFESSPVHCLKFLPSGKRRSPGKLGTTAILNRVTDKIQNLGVNSMLIYAPSINVCHDCCRSLFSMLLYQVLLDPYY